VPFSPNTFNPHGVYALWEKSEVFFSRFAILWKAFVLKLFQLDNALFSG
jgi:hypothetical protein